MLVLQNQGLQNQLDNLQQSQKPGINSQDIALKERARREVHEMVESHLRAGRATAKSTSYRCPGRRRIIRRECISSQTPGTVPSAHIVPDGSDSVCYVTDTGPMYYINLTMWWTCRSSFFHGYVRGGMVFDRETGELIVPVTGIYFVYSQVHLEISNSSNLIVAGTKTAMCPHRQPCSSTPLMRTEVFTDVSSDPFYHGGLFNLTANSTISIAAFGRVNGTIVDSLAYKTYFAHTFLGAYLVEEL